jgi:hypothetical protein
VTDRRRVSREQVDGVHMSARELVGTDGDALEWMFEGREQPSTSELEAEQ